MNPLALVLAATGTDITGSSSTSGSTTAGSSGEFPTVLLTALIWCTAATVIIVLLLPERTDEERSRIRLVALAGAIIPLVLATFGLNYQIGQEFIGGTTSFEEQHQWLTTPVQSSYHLGVDGVSLPLLLLSTLLFVIAILASWRVASRLRLYFALVLVMETGVNGALCSLDYLLLLFFWGMQIAPVFLLIAIWGGPGRMRAAWRYLGAASVGAALLTAAALLLAAKASNGAPSFDFVRDNTVNLAKGISGLGFWLSLAAFALTLPVVPLHTWMRDAVDEASAPVAVLLRGAVMTLGGYGLMRVSLTAFPVAAHRYGLVMVVFGVVTALWGAIAALGQDDLRRLLMYGAMSQMGMVLVAIGSESAIALNGAVLLLVADGLAGALLLLLAGAVQERTRTRSIARLGGLAWQMPKFAALWAVGGLTVIGVPFLAGFMGELMIFVGSYPVHRAATVLVMAGTIITTGYTIWTVQRVFFGPSKEAFARLKDATTLELTYMLPLAIAVVILGVLPGRVIPVINNGVQSVVARFTGGG
jgi:NADH-quinone oxidoreductase subunit M